MLLTIPLGVLEQALHGSLVQAVCIVAIAVLVSHWIWELLHRRRAAPEVDLKAVAPAAARLVNAKKVGRRLLVEVGELEPVGNWAALNDLLRRCGAWDDSVADDLAEADDIPREWRDLWLAEEKYVVVPASREDLNQLAGMISERLRQIDWMLGQLREEPIAR